MAFPVTQASETERSSSLGDQLCPRQRNWPLQGHFDLMCQFEQGAHEYAWFIFVHKRKTKLSIIYEVINNCLWSIYGALSIVQCAFGNMKRNYQKLLHHLPSQRPPPSRAGSSTYLYLKVPSQITFGIASCLLRNIQNGKRDCNAWHILEAWPWGCLNLTPCPFFLSVSWTPCWQLFVVFLSLLLASPDFVPVCVSASVLSAPSKVLSLIVCWIQCVTISESAPELTSLWCLQFLSRALDSVFLSA